MTERKKRLRKPKPAASNAVGIAANVTFTEDALATGLPRGSVGASAGVLTGAAFIGAAGAFRQGFGTFVRADLVALVTAAVTGNAVAVAIGTVQQLVVQHLFLRGGEGSVAIFYTDDGQNH